MRWREVLECVAAWIRAHEGLSIAPRGNLGGRAMNARTNDSLKTLPVESKEVAHLRAGLPAREEDDARRHHDEDARRAGDEAVRRERDELRLHVAVLESHIEEIRRRRDEEADWREGPSGGDGLPERRRMEEV